MSPDALAAYRRKKATYQRERYAKNIEQQRIIKRRAAAKHKAKNTAKINAIKLTSGCVDCGHDAHPVALQFDHIDPATKHKNIAQLVTCRWATIQAEIDKCEVRCANCHAIRSQAQAHLGMPRRDGTPKGSDVYLDNDESLPVLF